MNMTFENFTFDCNQPQDYYNIKDFSSCFKFFLKQKPGMAIFGFTLIFSIIISNSFVIMMLCRNKVKKVNVFNQIIIGHCIV